MRIFIDGRLNATSCENISIVRRRLSGSGRRMLASNKRRPIRVHQSMRGQLCDSIVNWTEEYKEKEQDDIMIEKRKVVAEAANEQHEQTSTQLPINNSNNNNFTINTTSLVQRLTFSSNNQSREDDETNSETTTTTTIPLSCLNKINSNISKKKIKSSKQKRLLFVEIRKAKHRFRFMSNNNLFAATRTICSSQRFGQIYGLLNMVSLILIMASISIGLSSQFTAKAQAQSTIQTNRALKNQQQPQVNIDVLSDNSRQLQLLRSANVELNRERSQRLQRDTSPAPDQSSMSGNQQQSQPTCGYPGSPAHASVTFNTSHVVAGTAASYTCDNGYELLGPPRRLCQANGTWSPVGIPFCGK